MNGYFSVSQIRDHFGGLYPKTTILRWLAEGRIQGIRLAGPQGRWLIPAAEVAKLEPRAPSRLEAELLTPNEAKK